MQSMRSIMLLGFAAVVVGSLAGCGFAVLVGAAAQTIGTFGMLGEMRT